MSFLITRFSESTAHISSFNGLSYYWTKLLESIDESSLAADFLLGKIMVAGCSQIIIQQVR